MRRLPVQPHSDSHRSRWVRRATLGIGIAGGQVGVAPAVSAATAEHPARDPNVQAKLVDIVTESLRSIRTSGALNDPAGQGSSITSCLVDMADTQPTPAAGPPSQVGTRGVGEATNFEES